MFMPHKSQRGSGPALGIWIVLLPWLYLLPPPRSSWIQYTNTNSRPPRPYVLATSHYYWNTTMSSDAWSSAMLACAFLTCLSGSVSPSPPAALKTSSENVCTWNVLAYELIYRIYIYIWIKREKWTYLEEFFCLLNINYLVMTSFIFLFVWIYIQEWQGLILHPASCINESNTNQ